MEPNPVEETAKKEEFYLGYEQWMPSPPKVQKPRSVFNAASLAYIGDSIYEVLFLFFFWLTMHVSCSTYLVPPLATAHAQYLCGLYL